MKILMVCLGNICRSPIAEGVLRHKAGIFGLDWEIASAGTLHYHVGSAPHISSQRVCEVHGIDISRQRAKLFSTDDFDHYDRIYAFAQDVYNGIETFARNKEDMLKVDFFMNESYPGKNMDVPDPYNGAEEGFSKVYQIIDRTCNDIIKRYSK